MKNKGRTHKWGNPEELNGIGNCKGTIAHITRNIDSMFSMSGFISKFDKKKWSKRVRGYFKSTTKKVLIGEQNGNEE